MIRIVCFLFVLIPISLNAQEFRKEMQLSLAECVELAIANNSTIVQQKYAVLLAEGTLGTRRNAFLPSANLSWNPSRSITGPREGSILDQTTGLIVTSLGESRVSGSQRVSSSISVPVYDASLLANLSASKHDLRSAELNLDNSRQTVIFQARQAYFSLLQAIKLLEVQQEQVRVSEETLRRSEILNEIGSSPIADVLSVRATLASARATLIQRENNVEIRRSDLSFALGLGTDVRIVPTETEFSVGTLSMNFEEALSRALEGHPNIVRQKYAMFADRASLSGSERNLRHPTVRLSGNYSWNLSTDEVFQGVEDLFLKNYSYSVSLNVTLPIFNMQNQNAVKNQKIQYLRTLEQYDQSRRQVAQDLQQSFLTLEQLRRSFAAGEAEVEAQEKFFELADESYKVGAGTFLQRLQAQRDLFNARNSLVQTIYNYQIEVSRLEQRLGRSLSQAGE